MTDLVEYRIANRELTLPPIQASLYEYVTAGNGIFLRAQRREFQAQICVTPCVVRGLLDLQAELSLNAPLVPRSIVEEMVQRSRTARDGEGRPCEIVFHLELDATGTWLCHVPSQSQATARVKPTDDSPSSSYARACVEIHSHVDMEACFSSHDDRDEAGFRLYSVLGCVSTTPTFRLRVGMYGYHHDIPAHWLFDLLPGIADAVTGQGTLLGPSQ